LLIAIGLDAAAAAESGITTTTLISKFVWKQELMNRNQEAAVAVTYSAKWAFTGGGFKTTTNSTNYSFHVMLVQTAAAI
jgi:hypothetical protein